MYAFAYLQSQFVRTAPDAPPTLSTSFHYEKNPLDPATTLPYYEHEISLLAPDSRLLRHFAMGISKKPADFAIHDRVEPEMLFEYCLSGSYLCNGRRLAPGDFILHPAYARYSSCPDGEDATILWCAWEGDVFADIADKLSHHDMSAVHHLGRSDTILRFFHAMIYTPDFTGVDIVPYITGFMQLLVALIPAADSAAPLPPLVRRAIDMIEFEYRTLTVETLAAALEVTPAHLSRSFRAAVGIPPKQYITNTRMERAIFLLCHADLPLRDIATGVGYDNYNNFYVTFRREYGVSPEVYRKENR